MFPLYQMPTKRSAEKNLVGGDDNHLPRFLEKRLKLFLGFDQEGLDLHNFGPLSLFPPESGGKGRK